MRNLLLALIFLLGACATPQQPPGYTSLRVCETTASVVQRLAAQRRAGLLSPETIKRVEHLISVVDPLCSAPVPPPNAEATIEATLAELEHILLLSSTARSALDI